MDLDANDVETVRARCCVGSCAGSGRIDRIGELFHLKPPPESFERIKDSARGRVFAIGSSRESRRGD